LTACARCGSTLSATAEFCGNCGAAVNGKAATSGRFSVPDPELAPNRGATDQTGGFGYESSSSQSAGAVDLGSVPVPFTLAHGEVMKSVFPLIRLRRPLGSTHGSLYVTDSRVVYRAEAKNVVNRSLVSYEVQISDITGFLFSQQLGVSPIAAAAAAVIMLGLLVVGQILLLILFAVLVALWVFVSFRSSDLAFTILERNVAAKDGLSLGKVSAAGRGNLLNSMWRLLTWPLLNIMSQIGFLDAQDAYAKASASESRQMFDTIGGLILDLQSRGALGEAE
jgi:hypothetical protein